MKSRMIWMAIAVYAIALLVVVATKWSQLSEKTANGSDAIVVTAQPTLSYKPRSENSSNSN